MGVHFACCHVYTRVYINRSQTAYVGRCPRCGRQARLRIRSGRHGRPVLHCLLSWLGLSTKIRRLVARPGHLRGRGRGGRDVAPAAVGGRCSQLIHQRLLGFCREPCWTSKWMRCSRRCRGTGREFQSGDVFYSVLIAEGASVVRHDYGVDAWQGPPEGAIGWWISKMPDPSCTEAAMGGPRRHAALL